MFCPEIQVLCFFCIPGFPEGAPQPDSPDYPPQHHARATASPTQHTQAQPSLLRHGPGLRLPAGLHQAHEGHQDGGAG